MNEKINCFVDNNPIKTEVRFSDSNLARPSAHHNVSGIPQRTECSWSRIEHINCSSLTAVWRLIFLDLARADDLEMVTCFATVSAVGCSDLVPPSDAWLKRSDNVATVGCYMTRQTWILTCDHNGRWTGTFGNCTQRTIDIFIHSEP